MAKEIRFVVGTRGDVRSSVWRLWANKADLYLAARTTAGLSKISFHASGTYRFAVVSQLPRPALHNWRRPKETDRGVTPVFDIVVPPPMIDQRFCDLPPNAKRIEFLRPPDTGTKIIIRILLVSPTITETDLRKLARDKPIFFHGSVPLPRENAWLVSYYDKFSTAEHAFFAKLVSTTKIHFDPGVSKDDIFFAQMHSLEASNNPPAIVDIQLGAANVDIPIQLRSP